MANFEFIPPFPAIVAGDQSTFTRTFEHRNWVDGQDLVQAGETPDELGLNARLNALERDLDTVRTDLVQSYMLIGELRTALAVALGQIQAELNRKSDKAKEGKDSKDGKESKESKDGKDGKESKESKDGKESKEGKEHKDGKEVKETKEDKDGKEAMGAAEKNDHGVPRHELAPPALFLDGVTGALDDAPGHAFIRADERPRVGERVLTREPAPPPLP
jgi:hypothetical protein